MHAQSEAVQEALAAQLAAVGLHPAVHLPVGGERKKEEREKDAVSQHSNKGTRTKSRTNVNGAAVTDS